MNAQPLIEYARALALKEAGVPSHRFCLRTEAGRVVRVAPVCLNRRWNEWESLEGRFYDGVPDGLRAVACTINGRGRVVLLLVEPVDIMAAPS